MPKYKKIPVTINAELFDGSYESAEWISLWSDKTIPLDNNFSGVLLIPTLEGTMKASPGDYIIRGVNGEYYPCKPDVFNKTYERIND